MSSNPQEIAGMVTFTEEILNERLYFLCSSFRYRCVRACIPSTCAVYFACCLFSHPGEVLVDIGALKGSGVHVISIIYNSNYQFCEKYSLLFVETDI